MNKKLTLHDITDFGWKYEKRFVGLPEFLFKGTNKDEYCGEYELEYDLKSNRLTIQNIYQEDGYHFIGRIKTQEEFMFLMKVMEFDIIESNIYISK